MLKYLRTHNMVLVWYVDNLLLLGTSPSHCIHHFTMLLNLFNKLGLQVNFKNSNLTPTQQLEYLGQLICLSNKVVMPLESEL